MKMFLLIFLATLVLSPEPARSLNPSFNDDVLGLIVFKADIEDPKGKLASWNEDDDSPCNNWAGVTCNPRSNRVSELNLDGFSLSGRIGRGLFQLEFLRKLSLAGNNLSGTITPNFARLESLRVVDLSENGLTGALPDNFFRQCGSLRAFSLAKNKFSGKIPGSLSSCSSIAALNLSSNQLSGSVPAGVWSLSSLRLLDLSDNRLEGEISDAIGGMMNLRTISLNKNRFSGQVPDAIGACSLLRSIDFSENSLSGYLPETMRKLSLCSYLKLGRNSFAGELPVWITEMKSVESLDVSGNAFSGQVPPSIGNLRSLNAMNFSTNNFTGSLPESLSNITRLISIDFSRNYFTGDLPSWIFRSDLRVLDLSDNAFTGTIPSSVEHMKVLDVLNLGQNKLSGSIPFEIGGANSLKELRLEKNFIGGKIPTSIKNCSSLTTLIISENNLTGPIPAEMGKLSGLQNVDLSSNSLAGALPRQLANLPHLVTFNISHNHLAGELPAGGFFNTISPFSVAGNPSLCGAAVNKSCPTIMPKPIVLNPNTTPDSGDGETLPDVGHKRIILSISALVAIGAAALIITGVIAITVLNLRVRSSTTTRSAMALTFSAGGDDDFTHSPTTDANSGKLVMFSGDPDFSTGAHALLNKDCELGRGGFGAVYRTVLRDGRAVAIKKLTVSSLVKSQDDFEREVKKLGRVKHDNLVSLEGYYWTQSLQLLIYEFVPGGSLYKHLHEGLGGNYLSWNDRFNIIIGAAKSLAHLHQSKIIHYNIKSSNVLIDGAGEAKLADSGLARLLPMLDRYVLSSKIQSALGYMAPEFACRTVKITEKCDVYGFGVLVLEVVTGKRPVEYMEDDVVVLCDMVRGALEEGRVEDCVDLKLQGKFPVEEAVPVMKLGLICTSQVPSNRPEMGEIVNILELIRCPSDESGSG